MRWLVKGRVAARAAVFVMLTGAALGPLARPGVARASGPSRAAAASKPSPTPPAPAPVHFLPRARSGSSFALDLHCGILTKDVTFDAPPAYKDSFSFWASKMKGGKRDELYQLVTLTDEAAADGSVPFHKQLARVQVSMEKDGQMINPAHEALDDLTKLAWEGSLDRFGGVREARQVAGGEIPDLADLTLRFAEGTLPVAEGPHDLAIGDAVKTVNALPLPARLHVAGLEAIGLLVKRDLVLEKVAGDQATFQVKTTYVNDPATKPTLPGVSCAIGGGGTGDATFDVKRGVFLGTHQTSTMTIDLEAPLRPLPEHPETEHAAPGKSHILLEIELSGQQTVHKIIGEED